MTAPVSEKNKKMQMFFFLHKLQTCKNDVKSKMAYLLKIHIAGAGKQNLETIVEAIRHLEGDHLFSEESGPHQVRIPLIMLSI